MVPQVFAPRAKPDGIDAIVSAADVEHALVDDARTVELLAGPEEPLVHAAVGARLEQAAVAAGNQGVVLTVNGGRGPAQRLAHVERLADRLSRRADHVQIAVAGMHADVAVGTDHGRTGNRAAEQILPTWLAGKQAAVNEHHQAILHGDEHAAGNVHGGTIPQRMARRVRRQFGGIPPQNPASGRFRTRWLRQGNRRGLGCFLCGGFFCYRLRDGWR